jgi:hypothetical protein
MFKVEVDVAFEDNVQKEIVKVAEEANVWAEVVQMVGPGGGWPIVRLSGNEEDVRALLVEWGFDPDCEDEVTIV